MKIRMYSNGIEAPLTAFIGNFLGKVCLGMAESLKTPRPVSSFKFEIAGDDVRIEVNHAPIPMNLRSGFCQVMVRNTIRGMVRDLKLDDPSGDIRIEADLEV